MIDEVFPEPELTAEELVVQAATAGTAIDVLWVSLQGKPGVLANPTVFADVYHQVRHAALLLPGIQEQLIEYQAERLRDARAQIDAMRHTQIRDSWKRRI